VKATFRIGRIGGIEVGVHWTVGLIVALAAWGLAASVLPEVVADQADIAYAVAGILAALGLMGSILAHELSHSLVARRQGVEVERITLWMLGGVAHLGGRAQTPKSEFQIAIAGPLMSVAIGVGSFVVATLLALLGAPELLIATLGWLSVVNVILAAFNLLPGAPLDGGRVLTAILWQQSGNEQLARWRSAKAGEILGQVLLVGGLVLLAAFGRPDGLWLALIGWFVLSSARGEENAAEMETVFEGLTIGDVMTRDLVTADGSRTVDDFVLHDVGATHVGSFPLIGPEGEPTGIVTLRQIHRLPRERWTTTHLDQIGTPADRMTTAIENDLLVDVLMRSRSGDGRIVVVDVDGRLSGLITPTDVNAAFERMTLVRSPGH
jgi:Zn-dependent protease